MQEIVHNLLTQRRQTLATAESCTGGSIAARFTAMPGASAYFLCGVVAYSNESKNNLLGVDPETIASRGAVSEEVKEITRFCRITLRTGSIQAESFIRYLYLNGKIIEPKIAIGGIFYVEQQGYVELYMPKGTVNEDGSITVGDYEKVTLPKTTNIVVPKPMKTP